MITWRVGGEHWGYYSNSLQDYGRVTALYLVVRPRASPLYSEWWWWWWWWWCGLLFCLLTASCCSQSSPTSKQSSMSFCHYKCYCYSPQGYGRVTAPYLEIRPRASPLYSEWWWWWWWWWCGLLFCLLTASCCSQSSPTSKPRSVSYCHHKHYSQ